ncbi:MAG: hypothetical protein ABJN36_11645 [Cyclobacteriaceae bacterium]
MKNSIIYLLALASIAFTSSCDTDDLGHGALGPIEFSYLTFFIDPIPMNGNIQVYFDENGQALLLITNFEGKKYRSDGVNDDGFYEAYIEIGHRKIAENIGDTTFYQPATWSYNLPVLLDTITKIEVKVDSAYFEKDQPEMTKIRYYMPYELVENGYKDYRIAPSPFYKEEALSQFNEKSKALMDGSFYVDLPPAAETGEYTFEISVTFSSGEIAIFTSDPVFIEGK